MALFGKSTHVDRKLDERARLRFEFPQPEGKLPQIRLCPFFENPTISESKAANLVKYDTLGRPGTLFGFTGAKSRTFKVDFHMTLPHLVNMATSHLTRLPSPPTAEQLQEEFFNKNRTAKEAGTITSQWEKKRAELARLINGTTVDEQLLIGMRDRGLISGGDAEALHAGTFGGSSPVPLPESSPDYDLALKGSNGSVYGESALFQQTVEFMIFWINLIRSSVLNNVNNPTLGPPIIRLSFGMLYNNIPTVAENYSIAIDELAGYDVVSLLPNRIKLSLTLHEVQKNPNSDSDQRREDTIFGWERNIDRIFLKESNGNPTADDYSQQLWGGSIYDNS